MPRRSKQKINADREELKKLINDMKSVEDIMKWKNWPHKDDLKLFTVEKYNEEKTNKLKWERTDVLYSFLGIYVIGLAAYFPDEFIRSGVDIEDQDKNKIYSLKKINEIRKNKKELFLDSNEQLIEFIKVYFSIGNVIPTWPGANVDRGSSNMYDIPELYFSKNETWTRILNELYKNAYLDDLLNSKLVFENNCSFDNDPPYWKFSSTKQFLDSIIDERFSKEVRQYLYSMWLKRIVGIINKRNHLIEEELKK